MCHHRHFWTSKRLNAQGIQTAADLAAADPVRIRRAYGVVLERTVRELGGEPSISIASRLPYKQQILVSRSFGHDVDDVEEIRAALVTFVARVAEKLRGQACHAQEVSVFLMTNPFKEHLPQYKKAVAIRLDEPSDDVSRLMKSALQGLAHIYRPGFAYKKAGVILGEIWPNASVQLSLFGQAQPQQRRNVGAVMDRINRDFGSGAVRFGASDVGQGWRMNQQRLSPRYSTRWGDLRMVS